MSARSSTRTEKRVGGVHAVRDGEVVEPVEQRAPGALRVAASSASSSAALMPSLSRTVRRVDAVAERLLVAEGQVRHPPDPLEAGQRLLVPHPRGRAPSPRAAGRRRSSWRTRRRPRRPARARASRAARPTSSPRSIRQRRPSRPAAGRHRDGAPVGVGVVGDDQVGPGPLRPGRAPRRSPRAPRGWGRPRSGSPGRGRPARRRRPGSGKPARSNARAHDVVADAVQRGVHDGEVARRVRCDDRGDARRGSPRRRRRRGSPSRRRRGRPARPRRPRRCGRRSARRPAGRSGSRRRGRPCSRCPAAGCGSR